MTDDPIGKFLIVGVQNFGRMQTRQFGAQGFERQFGDGKLSGGDIGIRNRCSVQVQNDRSEIVIRVSGQEARLGHGSGSHHAYHFAFDQSLGGHFADLFADGDVVAFFDQAREIVFDGMIGNARQRHAYPAANRARCEHDVEFARGDLGVLVEGFIKIAKPEEENGIGMLLFFFEVLPADGGDIFVGHSLILLWA